MKSKRVLRPLVVMLVLALVVSFAGFSGVAAAGSKPEKVNVIIGFNASPGASEEALVRAFGGSIKYTYSIIPAIAASLPLTAVSALQRNPRIARIEPDGEVFATATSPEYKWDITQIGADVVHNANNNLGHGVKVAIIDTGIDYNHPDLAGRFADGYDFVNRDTDPMDDNNHGTHVAGTIAAIVNGTGLVGVAPEVSLYALKVLNRRGSGNFSDVIAALQWCGSNGIQVTNSSFGSSSNPDDYGYFLEDAYDATASSMFHVAAAGNEGTTAGDTNTVGFPAQYESVFAVAATDSLKNRASFSSTGSAVDIAAPGVSIYSTIRNGGYAYYSGTSMASPHVAGVAALVIASGVTGPANIRERLTSTADPLGTEAWYGSGLVDADEAAPTVLVPPAPIPVHISSIAYSKYTSKRTVSLKVKVTLVTTDSASPKPMPGATISAQVVEVTTAKISYVSGTTKTDGSVEFTVSNAKLNTPYTTTVTSVLKTGITWDSATDINKVFTDSIS